MITPATAPTRELGSAAGALSHSEAWVIGAEPIQSRLVRPVIRLAELAGERILELYGSDVPTKLKHDCSPLTSADRAAHELICEGLHSTTPQIPVLSEESAEDEGRGRAAWERFWLVDPLDGTKEFLKRTGEFTVNIALIERGLPVLGVVHVPVHRRTYFAAAGGGAFRQTAGAMPEPIRCRRAEPRRLTVVASRDHAGPSVRALLDRLPPESAISIGSSLKFCMIAEGSADLYPRDGPTMEWDTAAAQCIVEEAGGRVLELGGDRLGYNKPDLRNPALVTLGDPDLAWKSLLD
jgi:3'(2'), 5'-bisphosphate nucleotidase